MSCQICSCGREIPNCHSFVHHLSLKNGETPYTKKRTQLFLTSFSSSFNLNTFFNFFLIALKFAPLRSFESFQFVPRAALPLSAAASQAPEKELYLKQTRGVTIQRRTNKLCNNWNILELALWKHDNHDTEQLVNFQNFIPRMSVLLDAVVKVESHRTRKMVETRMDECHPSSSPAIIFCEGPAKSSRKDPHYRHNRYTDR